MATIPHQSFIQPNEFKYLSIDSLKTNSIHWTCENIDSATNSNNKSRIIGWFSDGDGVSTNSAFNIYHNHQYLHLFTIVLIIWTM